MGARICRNSPDASPHRTSGRSSIVSAYTSEILVMSMQDCRNKRGASQRREIGTLDTLSGVDVVAPRSGTISGWCHPAWHPELALKRFKSIIGREGRESHEGRESQ